MTYLNEYEPFAAKWLRNLYPKATVDDRSILEVRPADLAGHERVHFFAGIAGWELAADLAGWDGPLWTGSAPCQPFSSAGKRKGGDDSRDLWPAFFALVRECRPDVLAGEQVDDAIGHGWLDRVCADLEGEGYAVCAVVLGAHSVGAPHIRQRLYWGAVRVADADGRLSRDGDIQRGGEHGLLAEDGRTRDGLADAPGDRLPRGQVPRGGRAGAPHDGAVGGRGALVRRGASPWLRSVLIPCTDGKLRRVPAEESDAQSGVLGVADGVPGDVVRPCSSRYPLATSTRTRVGRLRAFGNAVVPQVAAEFLMALRESVTASHRFEQNQHVTPPGTSRTICDC